MPLAGTGKVKADNPPRSEPDVMVRHVSRTFRSCEETGGGVWV